MKKAIRIIALLVVAGLLIALMIFNMSSKPSNSETVWDERTTIGNIDAKNYYVMYTDLACPYCSVFSRLIMENEDEFKRDYIEGKDILYEVRVTDFLYEYGGNDIEMSRWGAEGVYCATKEDKFWEYYHGALKSLWDDYHSKGIGVSKTATPIDGMTRDYWVKIGEKIGFDKNEFSDCMSNSNTIQAIKDNTAKAAKIVDGGLPYFVFGKFKTGGFDNNWDWSYVKQYLDAGLK
ncbi:thioredoxin domain-containing protein [Candidatus Saccharibacteria bacterium]|nr:thioredoxin domain-containing protein [Candidatus Saccharibacteria bacterium]